MAQKKKATSKKKPVTKAKAKPAPPSKPQYDDVLRARKEMNAADEQVTVAGRALNRAKAYFSDFDTRNTMIEKAGADLREARAVASAANENFKRVKAAAE